MKRVLGAVVTIVLLVVYPMFHANNVVELALRNAFPGWEMTYKSVWPRILGGASASDVTLFPYGAEDAEESYHFEHVTIAIPFFQYYWSLAKGRKFLQVINAVELRFEGGRGHMAVPFTEGLDMIGNTSLSLFEAEGCADDNWWADDELVAMGLPDSPLKMDLAWSRANDRLHLHHKLSRPGVGRVEYRGERGADESLPLLGIYKVILDEPASEHWHLVDEGFIAARNAHCAKKDGVDIATFVDRHMLSVRRVLLAEGLAPTASLETAYRGFASKGGEFMLALEFPRMGGFDFADDAVLGDLVGRVSGNITIDNQPLGLALTDVHARPFPEDSELTTFKILQAEQPALAPPAAAEPVAVAAATSVGAPAPAPTAAGVEEIYVAMPVVETVVAAEQAEPDAQTTISDYRELGKQVGQRFIVHFKNKPAIRIEVVGVDAGAVRVRRRMPSGWAEHVLDRGGFDFAERVR